MRFFTSSLFAIAALAASVLAAENPMIFPDAAHPMTAGEMYDITWTPTTSETITLTLRQGDSGNLDDVLIIVGNYPNSGKFTWTPDTSLPAGDDYAIMITDKKGNVNYTSLISIKSSTPKASSTKSSSTVKSTSTASKPSASKTTEESSTASESTSTESETPIITSTAVMTVVHGNTTTLVTSMIGTGSSSNATVTGIYGNSTRTATRSSKPTSDEPSETAQAISTGAAAGLLKSPLALVVCLIGAVIYLN